MLLLEFYFFSLNTETHPDHILITLGEKLCLFATQRADERAAVSTLVRRYGNKNK